MGNNKDNIKLLPINELVTVLSDIDNELFSRVKNKFPEINEELNVGIWAGESEKLESDRVVLTKAKFASEVLGVAICHSECALKVLSRKIHIANRIRLVGQIAAVIGSSGTILAMGFGKDSVAQVSAVLALLGSISTIISTYTEKVVSTKAGTISEIYLSLSGQLQEAIFLRNNINAHIQHNSSTVELENLVAMSNELCRKINTNALQVPKIWHAKPTKAYYKEEYAFAEE